MSVSDSDREDYEQGRRDRKAGLFNQFVWDNTGQHPDSDAYYKGRNGEQLDDDKEEDDD
jgi:hypothetical protein